MKIALYSIATLLQGVEASFRLARELEIKYLEVFPHRWTRADDLKHWENQYGVQVVAIDERFTWNKTPFGVARQEYPLIEKGLAFAWWALFGRGDDERIPKMIQALRSTAGLPLWIIHPDVISQMGRLAFEDYLTARRLTLVVENERPKRGYDRLLWDPWLITGRYRPLGCKIALDLRHLTIAAQHTGARLDPFDLFRILHPEVLHFNCGTHLDYSLAPEEEIEFWLKEFELHQPEWLVIETSPRPGQKGRLEKTLQLLAPLLEASV